MTPLPLSPDASAGTSLDAFLGGRLMMRQPAQTYRAGMDAVLLAACVPAKPGARVLDIGAGTGAVGLCLLARVGGLHLTALECDALKLDLARANAQANGFETCFSPLLADVFTHIWAANDVFDHVVTNPPFHASGRHTASPDPGQALAHHMPDEHVPLWLEQAAKRVKPGGTLSLIHRPEALPLVLGALQGRVGALVVLPLVSRAGEPAKRMIVQGIKGRKTPLRLLSPLVLHGVKDHFTAEAQRLLRDGEGLRMV